MLATTNKAAGLFAQTYVKGLIILFYGLAWLIASLAGYTLLDSLFAASEGLATNLLLATLSSVLAGGLGGATVILYGLAQHVPRNFQNQSLFPYLLRPIIGLVASVVVLYLVAIPGALIMNYAGSREILLAQTLLSPTFVAIQILLGWIAGFYQQRALNKIKTLLKKGSKNETSPTSAEADVLDENAPLFYKAWSQQQKQIMRWSYTWGIFLLGYAIIWMIALLALYFSSEGILASLEAGDQIVAAGLVLAAWPAAVAGGLGGVCTILYDLYRHVSYRQDFHRRYLMAYLVRPVIGFVFGLMIYFLVASGYLTVVNEADGSKIIDSSRALMLLLLLGWIAGFRQQTVADITQQLIRHILVFFKSALAVLHPKNWFDKARRDEALAEVSEQSEFFRPLNRESDSNPKF